MQATTCIEPTVEPEVFEVLRKNKAEAAFQTACDVARSSFPKMLSFHVDLLDDPDVNGRAWVMLNVLVSRRDPMEYPSGELDRFHEELAKRISRELVPLFGVFFLFHPE
ncbi:MAG TPA: hypothetical protein DDY78_19550 [Planctomycetales bacterium]|nr:hypothetical protein [Planctomycetales bacterium]